MKSHCDGTVSLSPRERDIARDLIQGVSVKATAARLEISPHTVRQYSRQICSALGLSGRPMFFRWLIQHPKAVEGEKVDRNLHRVDCRCGSAVCLPPAA